MDSGARVQKIRSRASTESARISNVSPWTRHPTRHHGATAARKSPKPRIAFKKACAFYVDSIFDVKLDSIRFNSQYI